MNKRELIEHISSTLDKYFKNTTFVKPVLTITEIAESDEVSLEFEVNKNCILLDDNRQELNKPVVPHFVADWISYVKGWNKSLHYALSKASDEVLSWFCEDKLNWQEIFARAWLDGYEVEKEKRYRVRIKGVCFNSCLIFEKINKKWFFSSIHEMDHQIGNHTRKQLEQAGFGWVFECPGIEIEEVE